MTSIHSENREIRGSAARGDSVVWPLKDRIFKKWLTDEFKSSSMSSKFQGEGRSHVFVGENRGACNMILIMGKEPWSWISSKNRGSEVARSGRGKAEGRMEKVKRT